MTAAKQDSSDPPIRVTSQETCVNCGQAGHVLYSNVRDLLFGVPGEWNVRQCSHRACQLMWLDPMPDPAELHRFYQTYHTHIPAKSHTSDQSTQPLKIKSRQLGYLANHFGYARQDCSWWTRLSGWTLWLNPGKRLRLDYVVMHLGHVPGGRVLDVGCGRGATLETLQQLGWEVEGVDFDPAAADVARSRGVTVRQGSLFDQAYPEASFDAVVMSHLIEHVSDPLALIRECERILKPGGRVVIVTPNSRSLSHYLFGGAWRGLEPPRHLYIQNSDSLAQIAAAAGFCDVQLKTSARRAKEMFREAFAIRRKQAGATAERLPIWQRLFSRVLEMAEICLLFGGRKDIGEELVCIAVKHSAPPAVTLPRKVRHAA